MPKTTAKNVNPDAPIYVVSCSETDRDGTILKTPVRIEVVGLFGSIKKATEEINRRLIEKKNKVSAYYEALLKDIQEEINQNIVELAGEKDPEQQQLIQYTIETLKQKQLHYEESKVPEFFIQNDADGDISEITTRDDSLGWICAFDIQKMTIIQ